MGRSDQHSRVVGPNPSSHWLGGEDPPYFLDLQFALFLLMEFIHNFSTSLIIVSRRDTLLDKGSSYVLPLIVLLESKWGRVREKLYWKWKWHIHRKLSNGLYISAKWQWKDGRFSGYTTTQNLPKTRPFYVLYNILFFVGHKAPHWTRKQVIHTVHPLISSRFVTVNVLWEIRVKKLHIKECVCLLWNSSVLPVYSSKFNLFKCWITLFYYSLLHMKRQ